MFVSVTTRFLCYHLDTDYEKRVEDLICNFKAMGCRMSQKLHVLHSHLNVFKGKMGDYSEEQGESFHQDLKDFERRNQGQKCSKRMMSDYVWHLVRDSDVLSTNEKLAVKRLFASLKNRIPAPKSRNLQSYVVIA